jgi:hypothetical protein
VTLPLPYLLYAEREEKLKERDWWWARPARRLQRDVALPACEVD